MWELPEPFTVYNTEYKRNFLIKYTNVQGDYIAEDGVVHKAKYLRPEQPERLRLKI